MSITSISRGVVVNFILNILLVFFLIHYKFEMSVEWFTACLIIILFLVCAFTGASSERFGQLNGSIVGLASSLVLFAFISQSTDLNWVLNAWISGVWLTVGYVAGLIGYKLLRKEKYSKVEDVKKETVED